MSRSSLRILLLGLIASVGLIGLGFVPAKRVGTELSQPTRLKTFIPRSWALSNSNKSDINVLNAWKLEEGSHNIVVAVVDTGIDPNHPSLRANLWKKLKDKGQEVFGWNFVKDMPNPGDEHGHGTHVAGIIGAIQDPTSGVSGVVHHVSIMPVKYYSDSNPGSVNLRNSVRALHYAIDQGARIINYSGGGPEFSEDEYLALKRAEKMGIIVVCAAGNERQDSDLPQNLYYPAAYRLSNIISVAATDINNNLLRSSNWGRKNVDVAAPGENIFSTLPGGRYGTMSGTSQATAFVSGIAAMLLSSDPSLKPTQVKELILGSVDKLSSLDRKIATSGRVNAYSALLALRNGHKTPDGMGKGNILAKSPTNFSKTLDFGMIEN